MSELQNIQREVKENILSDYLSGISLKELAKKYGFKNIRTVYYHISPLTFSHKIEHLKNRIQREEKEEEERQKQGVV